MKKSLSALLCAIVLFACSFGLTGCIFNRENPFPYRGKYKELYTTAIYSIPDAEGYMHHGEGAFDSVIYVWEQDDYGRTLFSYCEDYNDQIFGLVITQTYDETDVYFYPDVNYALTLIDSDHVYAGDSDIYLKNRTEKFYQEASAALKEKNDWNKPIDNSKCVSYPITDHKTFGKKASSLHRMKCNEILDAYTKTLHLPNPEVGPHRYNNILQVDAEGKVLHEIYGVHRNYGNPDWKPTDTFTWYSITLWVITDQNGNYDPEKGVMVMYSKANESDDSYIYNAEDVLAFKKQNNWKNSYCGA
ncbi:MAG: hypothetical protein J6D30_02385 [Clostridia bacterium]|nr:hypothetical protein [Clostridia bacterium]